MSNNSDLMSCSRLLIIIIIVELVPFLGLFELFGLCFAPSLPPRWLGDLPHQNKLTRFLKLLKLMLLCFAPSPLQKKRKKRENHPFSLFSMTFSIFFFFFSGPSLPGPLSGAPLLSLCSHPPLLTPPPLREPSLSWDSSSSGPLLSLERKNEGTNEKKRTRKRENQALFFFSWEREREGPWKKRGPRRAGAGQ